MRRALLLFTLLLCTLGALYASHAVSEPAPSPTGFALVELFTSEGCSSCPPADDNLARIGAIEGARIIPLAWHVDYWDRLGWPDPFARPAFTARQTRYARALKDRSLYTPQMVVNGRQGFVGSSRERADDAVRSALARPAEASLKLKAAPPGSGGWTVDYTVEGAPPGAVLHLVAVESGLSVAVKRGENAGRTLTHAHVVRGHAQRALKPGEARGRLSVQSAKGARPDALVGFVQRPGDMAVLAAEEVPARP